MALPKRIMIHNVFLTIELISEAGLQPAKRHTDMIASASTNTIANPKRGIHQKQATGSPEFRRRCPWVWGTLRNLPKGKLGGFQTGGFSNQGVSSHFFGKGPDVPCRCSYQAEKEEKSKSGKSPKKRERPKKYKSGRTSSNRETTPFDSSSP